MPEVYILDTECIWVDGRIYPKEVTIIDVERPLEMMQMFIKPPVCIANLTMADRKRNHFVESQIHGIPFDYGNNSLVQLKSCIPKHSIVFIQGIEKCYMMEIILSGVNIVHFDAPSIHKLANPYTHIHCPKLKHSHKHCSVIKAYKLLAYYYKQTCFDV